MAVSGLRKPVLVLQHVPWEQPGLITAALTQYAPEVPVEVRTVIDQHEPALPAASDIAGLVVMGGPMGALDDAAYPGLASERALLAAATDAAVPVLTVCLGMQLLAVALGARLHPGATREIGFAPVALSGDGIREPLLYPLTVEATANPRVLHWHGDTVDAPDGAAILASTAGTAVQGFRIAEAIGLQFHLEVTKDLLARWLAEPQMQADLTSGDAERLAADADDVLVSLVPRALTGLSDFARRVRARRG